MLRKYRRNEKDGVFIFGFTIIVAVEKMLEKMEENQDSIMSTLKSSEDEKELRFDLISMENDMKKIGVN